MILKGCRCEDDDEEDDDEGFNKCYYYADDGERNEDDNVSDKDGCDGGDINGDDDRDTGFSFLLCGLLVIKQRR